MKKIILSGMQPTKQLQLGNYLGALVNWVQLEKEYECLFLIVDLHAITVKHDPEKMADHCRYLVATYLAAGLDPEQSTFIIQSQVPEHAELTWILLCHTYMGELNRMTQFKDKSAKQGANIPAGLFTYPVLMAADILLYGTHLVPVGHDQKQHIELTRDLAIRMNNQYSGLFVVPEPYIAQAGARIMDLQEPTQKMSKSETNETGTIFLSDSDDVIRKKVKRAVTDSGTEVKYEESKHGVKNLLDIQSAILKKTPQEIVAQYVGKQYGHLKVETAEIVCETVRPLREKTAQFLADRTYLDGVLKRGAERARELAAKTLSRVHGAMGFLR